MKRKRSVQVIAIVAAAGLFAPRVFAQRVREVTGENLTSDKLVQVLTPKGPRPRGVGLKPPECSHLRQQASRGIKLAPKADIVSMVVEFETNSAQLTSDAEATLDKLEQALDSATLRPCCFEVQGYTDAIGSQEYNQKLSEARAQSVIDYLSNHAKDEKDRMIAKGFGKSHFVANNATEEGRHQNRRVQIVNLGYGTLSAE